MLVAFVAFSFSVAKADNLSAEQAKSIGTYYMAHQTGIDKLTPDQLKLVYQFENLELNIPSAYVFQLNDCGWIIIAASTVMDPVIAYSEEGVLDMSNIPDNMRWWLTSYADVIADIQVLDAKNDYPDSEEYSTLVKESLTASGAKDQTKYILMTTTWNQGTNYNPSYNYYCPQLNGRYCVTGCVATALAMLCNYYQYPVQPKGVVSTLFHGERLKLKLDTIQFDYSLMPHHLTDVYGNIVTTMDSVLEVAKLNYCLGLGVEMDYDPDGSGAQMPTAMSAMKFKFKYQQGTMRMRAATQDTNYINTLRRYLESGDIVAMRGQSSVGSGADAAGHAWLACGYRTDDQKRYYMNWGWGGSGNGWYNLGDNSMYISNQGYNFNVSQGCIFGMLPPEDSNIHHAHVAIREVDQTVLGTAYPNPTALSVALPYTTETAGDMMVYSIDGKLVATRRVQPGSGEVSLRVDALPKGVYIYRLNSQSGKFIVK